MDYHAYSNEFNPQDMYIDLSEKFREFCPEQIIIEDEEESQASQKTQSNEQSNRFPKTGHYTLEEDLKILEYVNSHCQESALPTSKKFWEFAVEQLNFLGGVRSADSLHERYRLYLMNLSEANKAEIKNWTTKHGNRGLLIFRKKARNYSSGERAYTYVMDTITLKHNPALSKWSETQEKRPEKKRRSKSKEKKRSTEIERQFQYSVEDSDDEATNRTIEYRSETNNNNNSNASVPGIIEVDEEASKSHTFFWRFNNSIQENNFTSKKISSKKEKASAYLTDSNDTDNWLKTLQNFAYQKPKHPNKLSRETSNKMSLTDKSSVQKKENQRQSIYLEEGEAEEIVYYSRKKVDPEMKTQNTQQLSQDFQNNENESLQQNRAFSRDNEEGIHIKGAIPSKKIKKNEDTAAGDKVLKLNQIEREIQKVRPDINQQTIQTIIEKANWLKNASQTHSKSPKEILNVFYSCSMNVKMLEKYFEGDQNLLWTKEEDEVLQEGRDRVIRILRKYKSPENVTIRQTFLKQFGELERQFDDGELLL